MNVQIAPSNSLPPRQYQTTTVTNSSEDTQDSFFLLPVISTGHDGQIKHKTHSSLETPLHYYSDWQISHHWRMICEVMGHDHDTHEQQVRAYARTRKPALLATSRRHLLSQELKKLEGRRKLIAIYSLYQLISIPAYLREETQQNQASSKTALAVLLPDWIEKTGFMIHERDLESFAQTLFELHDLH